MRTIRILQEHVRISDPHITSDNAERLSILGNVFEPLIRLGKDASIEPCLAESWRLSDDARTWTFKIRSDKTFQDGSALTVKDAVFSLRRLRDEVIDGELGTSGVIKSYLEGASIEASGEDVVVSTPLPMADLSDLLCDIPILSEDSVAALPTSFIGTGDFRVVDYDSKRLVLESDQLRLLWEEEPDAELRLDAVKKGSADVSAKLATHHALEKDIRIDRSATTVCATFMFNFQNNEVQNIHLRRAINLAVDLESLIDDVMFGSATALTGPLTERHLGFDPSTMAWPYDPEEARRELKLGQCENAELIIDIPSRLPDEAPILGERMCEYLTAVGLRPQLRIDDDRPGYAMRVRDGQIGTMACFDSSPGSTFRVFREKFHSGFAGPWWLGYENLDFDRLVDRAQSTASSEARRELYQQAYSILRDDAPWLFLYSPLRLTAISSSLKDWSPSSGALLLF